MRKISRAASVRKPEALAALVLAAGLAATCGAEAQELASFGVLAGSTITNTGPSVINGNLGLSPGTAITGFPPGIVGVPYAIFQTDGVAQRAQADLTTAYNVLAGRPATANLSGQDLGGMVLGPGVYAFDNAAQLTGTVTLDGGGNPNATFVFNVGSALTTASNAVVQLTNGTVGANVFFRVGSSATLGSTTTFRGKIIALSSITLITGTTINCGAALARNGAVTLDTNVIDICPAAPVIIGGGIDDLIGGVTDLPLGFVVLGLLTPDELAVARAELIGEIGALAGLARQQSMTSFMNNASNSGGPNAARNSGEFPEEPGTISVMGYAPTPQQRDGSAFVDFNSDLAPQDEAQWQGWASLYGGYSLTTGDPQAGTHDRTIRNYGFATGVDIAVSDDQQVGFSAGVGRVNFSLPGTLGTGHSDVFQVAATAKADFGDGFVSAAVAYGYSRTTTDRYVTIAGIDHFRATFGGHDLTGELKAGYHIGPVTPYAALSGGLSYTPAYSETTVSGASTFALDYHARTARTARTEIGATFDLGTASLDSGTTADFHAGVAWAHDFGSNNTTQASFQALPGSSFTVEAAQAARDSLLLSASTELTFDSGMVLGGSLNGSLSRNSRAIGATIKIGYTW